jgi:hypothetical protein
MDAGFGLVKTRGKQILRGKKKFEFGFSLFAQYWAVLGIRIH